ncbi:fucose isomerase [Clostridium sp. AM58-1XD]|uniref:L-fucose/L-arabinose isomerase family protein n=1 Tax=Clostridium sp. AM58-1XD TaxID=2292307 RepID=UPI000E48BC0B|nr:fucose isomerase [Clostridium sp. AM58-1XD]RGZ00645.1 fucose isomerase [Clostridium sp. AM58-1XD]
MEKNYPEIRLGLVMSSRNNFSEQLSADSAADLKQFTANEKMDVSVCPILVERENNISDILDFLRREKCNALAVVLGNFGAETPETILAERFDGPVMFAGVTEECDERMYDSRRDSYCGMLNCSYNLGIRGQKAYIPRYPVGTCEGIVKAMKKFLPVARAVVGLKALKIISFGPRPDDFVACNAPINGLYRLGVAIQENSELDLLLAFNRHEGDKRIPAVAEDMARELGSDKYKETLPAMAQYELTLLDWMEENKGDRKYVVFANKCWPAFQQAFRFLPCYVHGRLAGKGIPVACETDIYGALSEFIGLCAGEKPVTLMDINNAVPDDIYKKVQEDGYPYRQGELFMAFHCGNTNSCYLIRPELKYKLNRKDPYAPETGKELNRGTLEGRMIPGPSSVFRLHGAPDGSLLSYVVSGEILPVEVNTYGNYGLIGVREMERFYRYVLLDKHFPHHAAITFEDCSEAVYDIFEYLDIPYIGYNQPASIHYAKENPFYKDV